MAAKERRTRLLEIYDALYQRYGALNWWPADTPFEVCVGAILTQNTNWLNVEKAIANLKREGLLSAEAIREVHLERLAESIRPSGFFNVKSVRLKGFVRWLFERHGSLEAMFAGAWQPLRDELIAVPGIGPETCDSILLYAGGKPSFVVDAYTRRLFSRLGLVSEKDDYHRVRSLFMEHLPHEVPLFNEYHALIVEQCKRHCRKKPSCDGCPLGPACCHATHTPGKP
ncbi:endonuclease III domain-containing protein [Geomonas azotofigens]|uniref:endonuclease III domain-containing protein n=1 Tax=Geomonas azotofigens TaxID=2843196 RepID=UPI001C1123CE|nr:endonuclease III domain-containing protein [Geomonas azotofigens]MBU5611324.1 endonuclease III domain-containing protein [Geomonas azotofigens]